MKIFYWIIKVIGCVLTGIIVLMVYFGWVAMHGFGKMP